MTVGMRPYISILFLLSVLGCSSREHALESERIPGSDRVTERTFKSGKGALLLTRFKTLEDLQAVVRIEYFDVSSGSDSITSGVHLTFRHGEKLLTSTLRPGVSEADFIRVRDGSFWDRVKLAFRSPYALVHRGNILGAYLLARRPFKIFGAGDIAFYDLAETMMYHIRENDMRSMPAEDLSEKGYINTFNHIIAQAIVTTLFTEKQADFMADVHERYAMPALMTGVFSAEQLADRETGPVDNYVDIINNEIGQELGKVLRDKYRITRKTHWTPQLLADYLNDIQQYNSWVFQIAFQPFRPTDDAMIRFSDKINRIVHEPGQVWALYD
jgi:hypothetical protein